MKNKEGVGREGRTGGSGRGGGEGERARDSEEESKQHKPIDFSITTLPLAPL